MGTKKIASTVAVIMPPMTPVPMTLQTLAVLLAGAVLGAWRGTAAVLLYLGLAALGLPVLSEGSGGLSPFTGATAGLRGSANFAAFAGAKHALRALAQSMARELGPRNIHVAHVVVDGAIDTDFIRTTFPERYALKDQDGILNPEHIAENYWHLHNQPRDAWTFELDLRPYMERW